MTIKTCKEFDLNPIKQKVSLTWTRRKGRKPDVKYIWIASLNMGESYPITEADKKAVMKLMKDGQTDVLTDGYHFYTYQGSGKAQHFLTKISSQEITN